MTTTPEDRAEQTTYAVLTAIGRSQIMTSELEAATALITQALLQAEDAAYERAARLCDGVTERIDGRREQAHASPYFAQLIRRLKSEQGA